MKKNFYTYLLISFLFSGISGQDIQIATLTFDNTFQDTMGYLGSTIADTNVKFIADPDRPNRVAYLNGSSNSFIELDNGIFDRLETMSLMLWFKADKIEKWMNLFSFGRDQAGLGYENYMFFTLSNNAGLPQLTVNAGGDDATICRLSCDTNIVLDEAFETGAWHHLAITMDSLNVALYLDATLVEKKQFAFSPSVFDVFLAYLGKSLWPDPLYIGSIDEMLLFDRAVTALEVDSIYNGNWPPPTNIEKENRGNLLISRIYTYNNSLYIDLDEIKGQRAFVQIFNVTGKMIYSDKDYLSNKEIKLKSGLYIVRLNSGEKLITKKIYINY